MATKSSTNLTKTSDEKEKEKEEGDEEQESSSGEDDGFLKNFSMVFKENFCREIESIMKYTITLRELVAAIQAMNISGDTDQIDQEKQTPISGWRYVQVYMKDVNFLGKKNKSEVEKMYVLFEKIGLAEEDIYPEIYAPDDKSNIVRVTTAYLTRMNFLNKEIVALLRRCNRRRKKVERALILQDLKAQCPKYKETVMQLDASCRELENYLLTVDNNTAYHQGHIKKSLTITVEMCKMKSTIVTGGKKETPRSPSGGKSSKARERAPVTEKSMMVKKK